MTHAGSTDTSKGTPAHTRTITAKDSINSFIHPEDECQMLTANAFIMPRELDVKHLKLMKRLGEGQFGEVWSARLVYSTEL